MKFWLGGLRTLSACTAVEPNTFEVDISRSPEAVATLMLCGKAKPLKRNGQMLAQPSTCEGEGAVRVRFEDGRMAECPIGYVTNGLGQDFRFRREDGRCLPVG